MSTTLARLVPGLIALAVGLGSTVPAFGQAAASELTKPKSWKEFTSYMVDGGDLGWWETRGTTTLHVS